MRRWSDGLNSLQGMVIKKAGTGEVGGEVVLSSCGVLEMI